MLYTPWTQKLTNKLLEIIKTGIVLLDQQGNILMINEWAEKLLGYSKGRLINQNIEVLFFPEDRQIFLPNIIKKTKTDQGFEGEVLFHKKDKGSIFINLSTALYREEVSDKELIIFTIQDLSELKKLEEAYLDSERFAGLGKMTDQIAHQILNPISSIGGFALRLTKEQRPFEEYSRYTEIIQHEAKRLEYIIERLVEFAQAHLVGYDALSLPLIFNQIQVAYQTVSRSDSPLIKFSSEALLSKAPFFGDKALLTRALKCIFQNAFESDSKTGEVELSGEIKGNQVNFRVKDHGDGIPPENLPLIFDPFFTTKINGLGLGLTLAKRIIGDHKGHIEVESAPGKGTEVIVTIPKDRRREIRTTSL